MPLKMRGPNVKSRSAAPLKQQERNENFKVGVEIILKRKLECFSAEKYIFFYSVMKKNFSLCSCTFICYYFKIIEIEFPFDIL